MTKPTEYDANVALLNAAEETARVVNTLKARSRIKRPQSFNPAKKAVGPDQELRRAIMIRNTIGMPAAAGYMKDHNWSFEAALHVLCGPAALDRLDALRMTPCAR